MISISCTSCKTVLNIDDAFAGGVCRCQHCGTIQTVPSHLKDSGQSGSGVVAAAATKSKALYRNEARPELSGTGLDELAEIVASSGLAGSGLSDKTAPRKKPQVPRLPPQPKAPKIKPAHLWASAAVVTIVVLVGIIVWLVTRGTTPDASQQAVIAPPQVDPVTGEVQVPEGPSFLGIPITEPTVVYVLDRGSATQDVFGHLKEACLNSIASLGSDRRFQVIFWDNHSELASFPADSMTYATPQNVQMAREAFDKIFAFGQTNAKPALEKAYKQNPALIVLATGKGWDLEEAFLKQTEPAWSGKNTPIHTFSVGTNSGSSMALKAIATQTGGQYREISTADLRTYAD